MIAPKPCSVCNGVLALLGHLGRITWLRCTACGIDTSVMRRGRNQAKGRRRSRTDMRRDKQRSRSVE